MSLYHVWNEGILLDLKNTLALAFVKPKRFWDFHKTQILDEEETDLSHDQIKALGRNSASSFNNKLEKLEEDASEEIVGKLGMRNFEFCNKLGSLAVKEFGVYFPAIATLSVPDWRWEARKEEIQDVLHTDSLEEWTDGELSPMEENQE